MGKRGRGAPPLEVRFWEKVEKTDTCWNWTAAISTSGYGVIQDSGKVRYAHRMSYELANGPIATGLVIDHTCHSKACVNPGHLRAVSNKQNLENRDRANRQNKHSGVRGVSWHKTSGKWIVFVGHNYRKVYGGYYDTIEEAAEAAKNLRNRLHTHNDADRKAA